MAGHSRIDRDHHTAGGAHCLRGLNLGGGAASQTGEEADTYGYYDTHRVCSCMVWFTTVVVSHFTLCRNRLSCLCVAGAIPRRSRSDAQITEKADP